MKQPLALTLLAGLVDAAVFVGLGGVFVANQTGNCVLLAVGLAHWLDTGDPSGAVTGPLVSLLAFCLGALAAGPLNNEKSRLITEAALLLAALLLPGPRMAQIALAAIAMGIQSVHAVRLGVPGVTTTVVTGTLASLFSRVTNNEPQKSVLGLVWLLYVTGALIGAYVTYRLR
ncbi:DUF1275 domain-containing protein [Actinomadura barringtoniae]|uniref:DUF1275 domain-containing protein n=1 Tax=Actinomadura barringtoniae TaxID=1427535 RepID=A0A939PAJ8_9ACTN|nr:YoaK family protein [Actinomadura barringtoniae]MBO2449217.1 DUF1275 domain-containing protein [Actinomadura barringtoniae]